ncbi:elongation factor P [Caldisericum sp. AR60]|uniref:elongation factor P n=1 Tax=Caldisericum sp. AR60 TaxID=3397852 RepID=UPI0039FC9961
MISANELRSGVTFELDGELFVVISYQHIKPGKGSPFVRVKMKSLESDNIVERTFRPEEKFKKAFLERKPMQYLYKEGNNFVFMDLETFEQFYLSEEDVGDSANFLKENLEIQIIFYKNKPVSVELPNFVELKVVQTEPGVKGDTATSAMKPALLETGYKLQVPLFVNEGDVIRVDTRTGEYLERVNK